MQITKFKSKHSKRKIIIWLRTFKIIILNSLNKMAKFHLFPILSKTMISIERMMHSLLLEINVAIFNSRLHSQIIIQFLAFKKFHWMKMHNWTPRKASVLIQCYSLLYKINMNKVQLPNPLVILNRIFALMIDRDSFYKILIRSIIINNKSTSH